VKFLNVCLHVVQSSTVRVCPVTVVDISLYDCVYCGLMAQSRDHVIPVSYDRVSRHLATWDKSEVVPACSECNSLLSNRWLPSVAERAGFIATRLPSRYRLELAFPNWSEDDLEGLSKRFRKQITAKMKVRDLLKARIEFARTISGTTLSPQDCWLAA
jgi:hypothetical protein